MRRLSSRPCSQSAPSGAPAQPVPNLGQESYEEYCQRRIAERLPVAAGVVCGSVLFYAFGALISRPGDFERMLLPCGLELAIAVAAWCLGCGPLRRRAAHVALAADLLFTGVLVRQLLPPAGETSETALFVAVKMLATALFLPWGTRIQCLSAAVTVLLYWTRLTASGRATGAADFLHQMLGPLVAAVLSATGAAGAGQTRRALFVHGQRLEASAARFRALVENAFEAVWLLDRHGTVLYASPNNARVFGEEPERVVGRNGFEDLHPEDTERGKAAFLAMVEGRGRPVSDQVRMRHADGSWRWIEMTGCNLLDNPRVRAIVLNSRDITASKEAEAALRHREQYYRSLIESAQDVIAILEADATIRYASPSFERLLGHKPHEIFGVDAFQFVHREDLPVAQGRFKALLEQPDGAATVEYRFRHRDGSWRTLESLARNLLGDPAVAGVVVNSRDVTDRRAAEQEIQRLNADLEQRVRERTAELEAVNKELEAFSYSVSHDLRAPLRAIDGFSQALLEDCAERLDARGQEHLRRVRAATKRMGELIDDLLGLSRTMRSDMRWERVDLSTLAHDIAKELHAAQPERQVEFVIAPHLVARGDTRLLRVVLENLLGNAWKYTGKHEAARIEFGQVSEVGAQGPDAQGETPTPQSTFFVGDDGVGFDMTYANKLFRAFERLHAPAEFEGTGIGLATVQRVIHRHGGRVWAEGAVEQGARFYFTLPAAA